MDLKKYIREVDWEKIKELNRNGLLPYILPGYKTNKWLFRGTIIILLVWLFAAGWNMPFSKEDHFYLNCPANSPTPCENPFYRANYAVVGLDANYVCPSPGLCDFEFLQPGSSWGNPPNFFMKYASTFAWFIVIASFVLNHFLYNRGYKFPEVESK